ncbi:MAG: hypothetical protein LBL95_04010 [Deltaproteobacteria bacterium]|nr:hypothetical protein [Deltaproteobacteria bacterium]
MEFSGQEKNQGQAPQDPHDTHDPEVPAPIHYFGDIGTAFEPAWSLIGEGRLPVWGSVLAESQSRGRGRGGKPWVSPRGHVYAALRLPPGSPLDGPIASIGLALLASLALGELFGREIGIKWPNDLILGQGKVGGLLLEARRGALVAGIGLNLGAPPPGAREEGSLAPPAGALPVGLGPGELWPRLARQMRICYNQRFVGPDGPVLGPPGLADLATARLLGLGREVSVHSPSSVPPLPGQVLSGRLAGLDPSGALLIEAGQGRVAVWSGTLVLDR